MRTRSRRDPRPRMINRGRSVLLSAVRASVAQPHSRLFSTTSTAHRVPQDDGDASPWDQLDASVQEWEHRQLRGGQQEQSGSSASSGLAADEQMWLEAMNAKLDRIDRVEKRPTHATTSYNPVPQMHFASPEESATTLSDEEKRWLGAMNPAEKPTPRPSPSPSSAPHAAIPSSQRTLTHIDAQTNQPTMVNISSKPHTSRSATATGRVYLPYSLLPLLESSYSSTDINSPSGKGPVFTTARLAGIQAAKKTSDLIPLCHNVPLDGIDMDIDLVESYGNLNESYGNEDDGALIYISIRATATTHAGTGVEMEALTAVQVASLTVWDMLKAVAGKEMMIGEVSVVAKSGGKSGDWSKHDNDE